MSITNGYATLADVKAWMNIDDSTDDNELELAVEAASRLVDDYCGRFFFSQTATTRYYTPLTHDLVIVDDLVTVTTFKTDPGGDDTFEVTWTAGDYRLEPFNAAAEAEPRPYTRVATSSVGSYTLPAGIARSVEIVGTFGWSAIPTAVKKATILQATRLWRRGKDAPLGVVHLPGVEGAGGMRLHAKVDPDVQVLLHDFRRHVVAVG